MATVKTESILILSENSEDSFDLQGVPTQVRSFAEWLLEKSHQSKISLCMVNLFTSSKPAFILHTESYTYGKNESAGESDGRNATGCPDFGNSASGSNHGV
ncbi:MAG: hypothetical protein ACPL7A_00040 [Anaerolineales bacterium]